MLHVAVNAVSTAPGGGMYALLGFLEAWPQIQADVKATVYVSRQAVADRVKEIRPDVDVAPFAMGKSAAVHFAMQQFTLGPQIEKSGADVIYANQSMVGNCRVPQLVHHQNLKRFLYPNAWTSYREAGIRDAVKDIAARKAVRHAAVNMYIGDTVRHAAERLVPGSEDRNHTVYYGLSKTVLEAAESDKPSWNGEGAHIMALSHSSQHKNNPALIHTLRELVDREPEVPWELSICGNGQFAPTRELAAKLGLEDRVKFLGFCHTEQLDALFRKSVCLLFPSLIEGFGIPCIEAMARKCAVVASNTTAFPEVIGDAGIMVDPYATDAASQFAAAIQRLYHDQPYRETLVDRGLRRIRRFHWHDSTRQFTRLLHAAAAGVVPAAAPATGGAPAPRTVFRRP